MRKPSRPLLPTGPAKVPRGPVADLVRMKLTAYRLEDRVHIEDLDGVGLISLEIEGQLPKLLLDRLAEIRASE